MGTKKRIVHCDAFLFCLIHLVDDVNDGRL